MDCARESITTVASPESEWRRMDNNEKCAMTVYRSMKLSIATQYIYWSKDRWILNAGEFISKNTLGYKKELALNFFCSLVV